MSDTLNLANSFVIAKDESAILPDRTAHRPAELVAMERRFYRWVEEIPRIQRAVTQELVDISVKLIGPRARDRIYDPSGCLAVFGGIAAGQHGKLFDRIHAKIPAQHTARAAVGVVIDADTVEPVIILLRARTGDA